jgi:uncharacterized DUF497 family protein
VTTHLGGIRKWLARGDRSYTMRYEWDEAKQQSNIQKLGFDFLGIQKVFAGTTLTILDDWFDYGESRFITLGLLRGRVVVIASHVLSVRKPKQSNHRPLPPSPSEQVNCRRILCAASGHLPYRGGVNRRQ